MGQQLRVALAQLNMLVGDVSGNVAKVVASMARARHELKAHVVIFPELTLTGYPPEDLLLRPGLHREVLRGLEELKRQVTGIDVVIGYPAPAADGLRNSASLLREGRVIATYHKQHLPNYSVFDEKRYFEPGNAATVIDVQGIPVALTVCEDLWHPGPMAQARDAGAKLMINLNASPYHARKGGEREAVLRQRLAEAAMPVVYANLGGGQDELVFDGESLVMNAAGEVVLRGRPFVEEIYLAEFDVIEGVARPRQGVVHAPLADEESIYRAVVLGVRDYIEKNGFAGAVIGLSGGIDSALTLAIAVDAIGPEGMGVEHHLISIEPAFTAFHESLKDEFAGAEADVTEENIQARCRGVILMAISNKKRKILLTTGNKSEMAVGYATLYGDMAGGYAPIKDLPKTGGYQLARYLISVAPAIPQRVLERPPSAELR